ncbi:hypothetical protein BDF19DRAFT_435220 [Syncephalis fuscata]|nr:hypothetical protein BDF19DRAFT_435220 [Syncephalis fuscata]
MMMLAKKLSFPTVTAMLLLVSTMQNVAEARMPFFGGTQVAPAGGAQVTPVALGWDKKTNSFFGYPAGKAGAFGENGLILTSSGTTTMSAFGKLNGKSAEVQCAGINDKTIAPYNFYTKCMDPKFNTPADNEAKSVLNCPVKQYPRGQSITCYLVMPYTVTEDLYAVADRFKQVSANKSKDPRLAQVYIQNFVNKLKKAFDLLKRMGWYYNMDRSTVTIIGEHEVKFIKSNGFLDVKSVGFFGNGAYKAQTQRFDKAVTELVTGFYMRFGYNEAQIKPMLPTVLKGLLINSR